MKNETTITVETTVNAPINQVWKFWTTPEHIMNWNNASDDWHTPRAENDLRTGGKFSSTMASRDGQQSFNFKGTYEQVEEPHLIIYTMDDGRAVKIMFTENREATDIKEIFEAESAHSIDMQKVGWQAILDNFKKYTESN